MMARKKKPRTWFELMLARGGIKKTLKAMEFVVAYAVACDQLEQDEISIEEYAAYWKVSFSTGYRELRAFRECLPEFEQPHEFLEVAGTTDFRQKIPPRFAVANG